MNYEQLPKIELHLHLDCSLSFDLVQKLKPSISKKEFRDTFIAPDKCKDLADYIARAERGFNLMQNREQLRLVTLDLFEQLKKDNVIYAELRFAPLLHIEGGLSPEEVVDAVNKAVTEGIKAYNIHVGIVLCTLRHYSQEQSLKTVNLVQKFKGSNVLGFDIAANEAAFPIDNHIEAFKFASENGIKATAHAGEAKGPESVWETLENFHPLRIGHGVRSIEDEHLLSYIKEKNIHLEVCPTSNIQVGVYDKIENHSIDKLYDSGISLSINTDARTISNVSLSDEYRLLHRVFNWDLTHFKNCNLAAIEHAFAPVDLKQKIKAVLHKSYDI